MGKKKPSRLTAPQVAEIIGCNRQTVLNIANEHNIGTKYTSGRMFTYDQIDEVKSHITRKTGGKPKRVSKPDVKPSKVGTISVPQIAKEIGCHVSTVSRAARRIGVGEKTNAGFFFTDREATKLKKAINDKPGNPKMTAGRGAKRIGKKGGRPKQES